MSTTTRARIAATVAGVGAVAAATTGGLLAVSGTGAANAAGAPAYRGVQECRAHDVSATYHAVDAAMSHRFGRITVRNTSDTSCWIRGYGGLSYVGHGTGTQVGAPATRTPSSTPRTVLKPGDTVGSAVSEAVASVYPTSTCHPTHVDGFRVYLPDETHSLYVAHPTTGCAATSVDLLTHKAYR